MIPFLHEMPGVGKFTDTQNRLVIARRRGRGKLRVTANGYGVSFCGNGNVLKLDSGDDCTTL